MKRFTDTDKWRDPWFRKLSPGMKLAFMFIVDNCDAAGVWDADKELADFSIGSAVPWDKVLEAMGDRVKVLPGGKWYMTKFIQFQSGTLSQDCRPHAVIFSLLRKHGIEPSAKALDRVSKGYTKGSGKVIDAGPTSPAQPKRLTAPAREPNQLFEAFWVAYPRKVGKGKAEEAWTKHGCDKMTERVMAALQRMKGSPDWRKEGGEFIPHPATWLNRNGWDDEPQLALGATPKPQDPSGWREWLSTLPRAYEPYAGALDFLKQQFSKHAPK